MSLAWKAAGQNILAKGSGAWTLIASTLLTVSGNFTTGPDTTRVRIRGVGGGGAGGGCTSTAAAAAGAGGGGAGGFCEDLVSVSPNTAYAFVCGAAGVGVSGAAGGDGGDSTFSINGTTYTARKGSGALVATASTTLFANPGGSGGGAINSALLNAPGEPGSPGFTLIIATAIGVGGNGGSGPFGGGGIASNGPGNGNAGTGHGAGGSGSFTGASAVRTGGNGTAGAWIVDEYG